MTDQTPPKPIKILITAFEPWDQQARNLSQQVLEVVQAKLTKAGKLPSHVTLCFKVLPVTQGSAEDTKKILDEYAPDFVFALGQGHRSEQPIAHDVLGAFNDYQEGGIKTAPHQPLLAHGQLVNYGINSLDVFDRLQKETASIGILNRAGEGGTFSCNAWYYFSSLGMEQRGLPNRTMFWHLHVPVNATAENTQHYIETYANMVMASVPTLAEYIALPADSPFPKHLVEVTDATFEAQIFSAYGDGSRFINEYRERKEQVKSKEQVMKSTAPQDDQCASPPITPSPPPRSKAPSNNR